ncbi:MAG: EAL domain-containing protein, partial [Kangiellaceae bacterium]|nr:EAL domain-containing protein [Kangiellaceae bacterium]
MEKAGHVVGSSQPNLDNQTNQLLKVQKDILEIAVTGNNYQKALDNLCCAAEGLLPDSVASIMIFEPKKNGLFVRAAPNLPEAAIEALNELVPGKKSGSCGTAVFTSQPQFVCQTLSDARWEGFQDFVQSFNVLACWSMPIKNSKGEAVGSFALSSFHERKPGEFHYLLLETAAQLASIVLRREIEEQKLQLAAHYDGLTGLANRTTLFVHLKHAIDRCNRHGTELAVLFIDLDNFKQINDSYGHEVGDQVLRHVAQVMSTTVRKNDSLARLGGDEFVLVIEDFEDTTELARVAEKLLNAVVSFRERQYSVDISASIGISLYPADETNAEMLLQKADKAMYQAKTKGKNQAVFYRSALANLVSSRQQLEQELELALEENQIKAYLQPVVDLNTNKVIGAEILARWHHPHRGIVGPGEFLSEINKAGHMDKMTKQVLREAFNQTMCFFSDEKSFKKFTLSANIAPSQLAEGASQILSQILQETGFPASQFEIEIEESFTTSLTPGMRKELEEISRLGVGVVVDNFGKGSTSLAGLRQIPVNKIKIDRSFVNEIVDKDETKTVASSIIALARSLGISVAATGVESKDQRLFLKQNKCNSAQGYRLGKPVELIDFHRY